MPCRCPKSWCYHRVDCVRGASIKLAETIVELKGAEPWRAEIDRRQAISPAPAPTVKDDSDEPLALACNGPQVARLDNLMRRHEEIVEELTHSGIPAKRREMLVRSGQLLADAIDRVQHEGTPLDWRLRS